MVLLIMIYSEPKIYRMLYAANLPLWNKMWVRIYIQC